MYGSVASSRAGDGYCDGNSDSANPPPYRITHSSAMPSTVVLHMALTVTPQLITATSNAEIVPSATRLPSSETSSCNRSIAAASTTSDSTQNVVSTTASR